MTISLTEPTPVGDNLHVTDQSGTLNLVVAQAELWQSGVPSNWAVLNVAWDLDIQYPSICYKTGGQTGFNDLVVEHHKVGLVDGPGNLPISLAAAVLMVRQLASFRLFLCPKDVPSLNNLNPYYPVQNILVHCHSGLSRSVTVAGVYLHFANPGRWSSVRGAVREVARRRGLDGLQPQTEYLVQLAELPETQGLIQSGWNSRYLEPSAPCAC